MAATISKDIYGSEQKLYEVNLMIDKEKTGCFTCEQFGEFMAGNCIEFECRRDAWCYSKKMEEVFKKKCSFD